MIDMDMKELERRAKKGVRNISISPLYEKGKFYDMKTDKEIPESVGGCLAPDYNHCYMTWQSKWIDQEKTEHWSNEAYSFKTLEEANEGKRYLESI